MMNRFKWLAFAGACALALPAWAERLSIEEAVARALAAHPLLVAQDARRDVALKQADLDALRPAPRVGLDIENVLGSGAVSGLSGSETTLRATYTFERGDKARLRGARGAALVAVEALGRDSARAEIAFVARTRYLALAYAQEAAELAEEAVSIARALRADLRLRGARGAASVADEAQAEVAVARSELAAAQARNDVDAARVALTEMWEGEAATVTALEPLPTLPPISEPSIAERRVAAERALLDSERQLAKAQALADIDVEVGVRRFEALNDQALVLSVSLPLGQAPRSALLEARIAAQAQALDADVAAAARAQALQLLDLRLQLARAEREYAGLGDLITKADGVAALQRDAYERGAAPLSARLLGEQQAQQLRGERLAAAYRHRNLYAQWQRAVELGATP